MRSYLPTRIIRFLLAPLLSLWIAGAGCMLGCEGMITAAATRDNTQSTQHSDQTPTIVASGHACSTGGANKSHDCCKKGAVKEKTESAVSHPDDGMLGLSGSSSGMMNGCPLAVGRAAVVGKSHSGDSNATPLLAQSTFAELNSSERTAPLSPPPRLPNRGHTYLHCCVFLI